MDFNSPKNFRQTSYSPYSPNILPPKFLLNDKASAWLAWSSLTLFKRSNISGSGNIGYRVG